MKLFLVPLTPQFWEQYVGWFKAKNKPLPAFPPAGIWIGSDEQPVAGVCIYPADGPYAFAEHFAVNPAAPRRLQAYGLRLVTRKLQEYSAIVGKYVIAAPSFQSGFKALERAGFQESDAVLMVSSPRIVVADVAAWKSKHDTVPRMVLPTEPPPPPSTGYSVQEPPQDEPIGNVRAPRKKKR